MCPNGVTEAALALGTSVLATWGFKSLFGHHSLEVPRMAKWQSGALKMRDITPGSSPGARTTDSQPIRVSALFAKEMAPNGVVFE